MRVGLLEDDLAIQEMLLLILEDEGYTAITYASAKECLQGLGVIAPERTSPPVDLMIVDWRLSGDTSGTEVIRQIRTKSRLTSLPIILTTAATFYDIEELQNLHVALLEKPFSVDEVLTLIKSLVCPHSSF